MSCYIIYKGKNYTQEDFLDFLKSQIPSIQSVGEFTNHSGGAYGGDTYWDLIGREFGVTKHKHYRDAGNTSLSQKLRNNKVEATVLTSEQMEEARTQVEKLLGKKFPNTTQGNLQVRNYYQVANADAVYAVATLDSGKTGVSGGTNTAVQLGIKLNKPVYVWDINTEQWYKFEGGIVGSSTALYAKQIREQNKKEIKGINIFSRSTEKLGKRLTNPNWYAKDLMDVEAPYKANASKIKAPQLNAEEALKYDMNLMYNLQVQKFRKNPELIDEINDAGGLEFIKNSSHIVGVKNSRWEGKGMESNFIKVLAKSYETVAKELNKFQESDIKSDIVNSGFIPTETPTLTKNFAGVGSRDIENYSTLDKTTNKWTPRKEYVGDKKALAAQQAIRDVYEKTFKSQENNKQSQQTQSTSRVQIWKGFWTRKDVENNPDKVFLFGDNFEDARTGYVPSSTQAVIRGLPNAIGISTKNDRGTKESSYLTDADFNTFKQRVDEQIQKAKESGKTIVIPEDGIGTGKAQLKERAPKLFEFLQQELDKLKNTQPQSVEQSNLIEPGDHFNFENSRTLLQSVVDHPNVESYVKDLAQQLLDKVDIDSVNLNTYTPNANTLGGFSLPKNQININLEVFKKRGVNTVDRIAETIVHEYIHAATVQGLKDFKKGLNDNIHLKNINELFIDYRNSVKDEPEFQEFLNLLERNKNGEEFVGEELERIKKLQDKYYAAYKVEEFVTMGLSNSTTREIFKNRNLLQQLFDSIKEFLGLDNNVYKLLKKEYNAYLDSQANTKTEIKPYKYYGANYEIKVENGVGVDVIGYKGSITNKNKLLQEFNKNPNIDPQTGRSFQAGTEKKKESPVTESKYELFPGVYANEGQKRAIDSIEEFFAGDKDQFLLKGRGGTGKTTIVKKTLEQFDKSGVKILGSTISYEAKNVLQDNMQGYKTATLASVLGLIPDYAKDGSMFFREKTLEERMNNSGLITPLPIETVDILIVDEASMIDEFIYNKLLELKKPRTKILFMGDNVQIPPINSRTDEEGNVIKGENSDSPVWQLIDSGDYVELSERMRQGAESPILPITDLYAKNVEEIQSGETGLKNPLTDRTSNFQNNEGVLFTSDVNEVVNQFVEDIEGSTDIREAVIVGARNAVVDDMNLRVRKKLFETKEPFVIGDSIRINSPHVENNEVIFENGLRAKVKDVYELPEDNLGLKRYELEIEYIETNEKGNKFIRKAFLKTISPQDQKQYKNKLREMAARAKSFVPKTPESKKAWKEFFDIKSSTVDVGYGYAITSHKVQGSTYNSAYVLEGDIMSFPGGIEQTNRMMYTAVSRPRKKLVIFNPSVVESQQVSQPKIDIRAKVYEIFNLQGYMDIKTSHKTDKNLITAISHYVLEDLGYKTDQEKLQAVREGFKLSEYITTEQISDVHTRVRLNMKNIIEDEVDDGPVSLGGIKFTSSGYESEAKDAFKTPTLDLSTKVTSFLETLNFEINTFENLKEVTGYDAEAATDLLYKMVLLKNTNKIENNLVKEAAYVAISLLGKKNKTRTDLLHSIDQLDNYPKLYEQYKKRSPNLNDYKIKELILVDLVADSIYKNYNTPKDSYINRKSEYWSITGSSKFEKKFKYYINKIKRILEDFFGTNKLSSEEFNDLLSDISKDILDNNTYKFNVDLSPKEQLTNYEETIKEDKGAENIIKTFQDLGLYLTGSLAIRKQGSLYRDTKENLHDLDFTVPAEKSSEEIQKILDSIKLPRLPFIEDLVSPEDIEEYKLEQLTKHLHEIDLIKDIKKKYPTYKVETIFKGLNPGEFSIIGKIDDYAIDLFLVSNTEVSDSNSLGFQNWQDIFLAKLKMGRHKDIKDLVNFKAYNKNLNTKLAQTKGVRHFNFKNDNTIEQAFTCK